MLEFCHPQRLTDFDLSPTKKGLTLTPMATAELTHSIRHLSAMSQRWGAQLVAYVFLLFSAICAFMVSFCSPIFAYAELDPRGSSLVAQSLIQHGTLRVDGYKLPAAFWLFEVKNGHTYSTYPLGTPVFLLPFVAVALKNGADMQIDRSDLLLQKQVAGLTLIAFLLLAYFILRCFLEPIKSAILGSVWTLGTGVMSTMGAALWSINFAVILESVVVLIMVRYFTGRSDRLRPLVVGLCLFAGYLCRPSAALLAVPTTILLWRRSKISAIQTAAVFGVLLLFLCVFSLKEFGSWLPEYYSAYGATLGGLNLDYFRKAVYGLTFGPARGLFVYQPFLILILLGTILTARKLVCSSLYWLAVSWIVLDILLVAHWSMWWGGAGFGSRLLVESFPGWLILTGLVWSELSVWKERIVAFALCFGILAGFAIFINSYQALYNWSTFHWNGLPGSLGWTWDNPKNYYDWRYPQFLASPEMIRELKDQRPR